MFWDELVAIGGLGGEGGVVDLELCLPGRDFKEWRLKSFEAENSGKVRTGAFLPVTEVIISIRPVRFVTLSLFPAELSDRRGRLSCRLDQKS